MYVQQFDDATISICHAVCRDLVETRSKRLTVKDTAVAYQSDMCTLWD